MIYIILPKVMVLSHTNAPIDEWMPDHSIRGHPVRRVIFMGRSAHEEPAIEPRSAMFCFYRDFRVKHTHIVLLGIIVCIRVAHRIQAVRICWLWLAKAMGR